MALADAVPYAVAHWALDEASGNAIDSLTGNDLVETSGTIGAGAGKVTSSARDFEAGDTEYFAIADNADLDPGDIDFMLRFWVQFESLDQTAVLICKGNDITTSTTGELSYAVYYSTASSRFIFRFQIAGGGTNTVGATANNFGAASTGVWYLVHVWHDAANNQTGISVNAGTPDTTSHSTGISGSSASFKVGADGVINRYFDGLLNDIVFLQGRILDATERTADYNSGTGVAFADWAGGGGSATPKGVLGKPLYGPMRRVVF